MTWLDYLVLGFYLVGTISVGVFFARRNRTSGDMFTAGGKSPWWVAGLSGFMTMKSAGTFVVWGGMAYSQGVVAIAITSCLGASALLVGKFVAGKWRDTGVKTPAEFVDLRFGPVGVQIYTWVMMAIRIVTTAVALYSVAVMLVALTPLPQGMPLRDEATGHLQVSAALILFGVIITFYTAAGGLWAVLMTDVVQFIVLKLAVIFIICLLLIRLLNAPSAPLAPAGFFAPTSGDFGFVFFAGWIIVHFFIIGGEWAFSQRYISVPTAKDARWSAYLFGVLYLISPAIWLAPPLLFRLLVQGANPEQAYVLASQFVLPTGLLGLMVAAMFSASASAISGQINVYAGVLTEQIYRKYLCPDAKESQLVLAGRIFTLILGALLTVVAIGIPKMGGAEKIVLAVTGMFFAPLVAPIVFGLLGRKIDLRGAALSGGITLCAILFKQLALAPNGPLGQTSVARWTQHNPHITEVLIGAGLPLLILCAIEVLVRKQSVGWDRVVRHVESQNASVGISHDQTPLVIIYVTLGATGVLLCGLGGFCGSADTIIFGAFSLGVSALAWATKIWLSSKSKTSREVSSD